MATLQVEEILDKHTLGTLAPEDYAESLDALIAAYVELKEDWDRQERVDEWFVRLQPRVNSAMLAAIRRLVSLLPPEHETSACAVIDRLDRVVDSVGCVWRRVQAE